LQLYIFSFSVYDTRRDMGADGQLVDFAASPRTSSAVDQHSVLWREIDNVDLKVRVDIHVIVVVIRLVNATHHFSAAQQRSRSLFTSFAQREGLLKVFRESHRLSGRLLLTVSLTISFGLRSFRLRRGAGR
jgi:hypothetical protein